MFVVMLHLMRGCSEIRETELRRQDVIVVQFMEKILYKIEAIYNKSKTLRSISVKR